MSLSFSVTSGFVRPFLSMLNGACKLSDSIFLLPSDNSLEITSVHPSCTSHLLITIDAVHLDGYRYNRHVGHRNRSPDDTEGGPQPRQPAVYKDDAVAEEESFVPGSASERTQSNVLASATTVYGSSNATPTHLKGHRDADNTKRTEALGDDVAERDRPRRSTGGDGGQGDGEDVTLRVPTAALQSTLLHQNVGSLQSLHVRYTSLEVATVGGDDASSRAHARDGHLKPEMLCFDCMLSTGVVKSYQLHLVQGTPMRVAPASLRNYHLEVRGDAKQLGSLLAYLPSTSTSCMVVPAEGQLELRWWSSENEARGGGGGGRRAATRARGPGSGGGGGANNFDGLNGADSADRVNSVAATVTAQQTHFTTFQYFDQASLPTTPQGDGADKPRQSRREDTRPEVVSAVGYHRLPGKIMDVKSFKLAAWLAGQLGQPLQLVIGDAGTPVVFRTGAAAETFIVAEPEEEEAGPRKGGLRANAAGGGAGLVPMYPNFTHGYPSGAGRHPAAAMGDALGGDPVMSVSFALHVATSDVENPSDAAGGDAAGTGRTTTVRGATAAPATGRGSGQTTGDDFTRQQQQPRLSREASTHYGLSNVTTLAMGGTESSTTTTTTPAQTDGHDESTAGVAAAGPDPFLSPLASATPDQQQQQQQQHSHTTPARDTERSTSLGDVSRVSGSAASSLPHLSAAPLASATPYATPLQQYNGPSLVMIGTTPRASDGGFVATSQPIPARSQNTAYAADDEVYIVSPQQYSQRQHPSILLSVPNAAATLDAGNPTGSGGSSKQRLSSLYPLDYAAFASHAASRLQLDLTNADEDAHLLNASHHYQHGGPGDGVHGDERDGGANDHENESDEDGEAEAFPGATGDVDDDLQQFLDSCSAMMMMGPAPP